MFQINPRLLGVSFLWQDGVGIPARIWQFLTTRFVDSPSMAVSPFRLVVGITLLVTVLMFSGRLSRLIDRRLAKRAHINPGLRYTIAQLLRYLLITVGIVAVLKGAFLLDLTSVAVVFTALSVGIGFGLQYIAADIASGFILLFERPIRIGDRITIGEDEGDVQSIKLRTTIIYTNDRIAIIVPNSRLVSQRVINWSYGDPRARIAIPISVATTSDVNLVTETLLRAAEGVENVLTDPPPKVQFLKFGDYSLDFRLLVWTRQPNRHPQIKSDINYRIEKLFREAGIEIPYPKQEFLVRHVKAITEGEDLLAEDRAAEDSLDGRRE
ncbi:MAG TPA: mechanosensitive ion channel domain-containing protein [Pyrinomonadaceae bacterium]|jgi:small-conductance mechanosensitive channel|nr:mechanosensitive ion channel domain-containing protein [Pyrinomonadaceae bacterium]